MTDLTAFRITRQEYARDIEQLLNGEGGRRAQGRWHLRGMPVAYLGSSRALCMLERLVHLSIHPREDDAELTASRLAIPEDLATPTHVRRLTASDLDGVDPAWRQDGNRTCLRIGVQWFRDGDHFALQVPSAVIPAEWNLVINCTHPVIRDLIARAGFETAAVSIDPRIAEIISEDALRARRSR
ncbi:MAG: RES family NAD+ phosphorylase [Parvibaculum sp.]